MMGKQDGEQNRMSTTTSQTPSPTAIPISDRLQEDLKIYSLFRDYSKHEDNLVNNRLTWVLSIHGFLYATYGFTIQKKLEVIEKISESLAMPGKIINATKYLHDGGLVTSLLEIYLFLIFLSFIGGIISVFGVFSIEAAHNAADDLRHIFEGQFTPSTNVYDGARLYYIGDNNRRLTVPTIGGAGKEKKINIGKRASLTIPWVLCGGWAIAILFTGFEMCTILPKIF